MKILVCGPGLIGKKHIDICLNNSEVKEVVVLGLGGSSGISYSKSFNLKYYSCVRELLKIEKYFDGVIVSTPNDTHISLLKSLINNTKNFLIEKPLATHEADYLTFQTLQDKHNINILVGHHRLHNNIISQTKKLLDNGAIGKIVGFTGVAAFYKPDSYFKDGEWRTVLGGGPVALNLIHEIATIDHLFGNVEIVRSMKSNLHRGFEVEDTASLIFQTENGVQGTFFLSDCAVSPFSWELTTGENPSYPNYEKDCYNIYGSHGCLSVPQMQIYYQSGERSWWKDLKVENFLDLKKEDPFALQMSHFVEVIKGSQKPKVTVTDSIRYNKVLNWVLEE